MTNEARQERDSEMDVRVENHGSIFVLQPMTQLGRDWLDENTQSEAWQWLGGGLCVDWRYAEELAEAMRFAGLVVD